MILVCRVVAVAATLTVVAWGAWGTGHCASWSGGRVVAFSARHGRLCVLRGDVRHDVEAVTFTPDRNTMRVLFGTPNGEGGIVLPFDVRNPPLLSRSLGWERDALRLPSGNAFEWVRLPQRPVVLAVTLLALAGPVSRLVRRGQRFPPGHCQSCGYDLTGNTSGRCPECGTTRTVAAGG